MNTSCPAFLLSRIALLLLLSGIVPQSVRAQVDSIDSSKVEPARRQNAWVSAGIGIGAGGMAFAGSGWYSSNHLVAGVHAADVASLWGPEVHDAALLFGVRNLRHDGLFMIAAGPARLGGKMYAGNLYVPRTVAPYEVGIAVSAEAIVNFPIVGIGFDGFVARSGNRLVEGVTLSFQVGWLGI
jgi:hypothetical protein